MDLSLAKCEILMEVVESGSLTSASQRLGITQSAVSHSISGLEEELGYTLLTRGKNGVELTSDGKLFSSRIESFFLSGEQLMQDMADYGRSYRIPLKIGISLKKCNVSFMCFCAPIFIELLKVFLFKTPK